MSGTYVDVNLGYCSKEIKADYKQWKLNIWKELRGLQEKTESRK